LERTKEVRIMLMGVSGSRAKRIAENMQVYFVANTNG
jgi:hypothetical protein